MVGAAAASMARIVSADNFVSAFAQSVAAIIATELGDRTFFIAAIMAMRYSRSAVLLGALGALILMTVISGVAGLAALAWIPPLMVKVAAGCLMLYFGIMMFRQGLALKKDAGFDELEEVEEETKAKDEEEGRTQPESRVKSFAKVATEAFTMTFLAEWGDRSQLATIALTASQSPVGVMLGGFVGHALCTGFAVVGGRFIANYVSERTVMLCGGALFVCFGAYTLLLG